MKILKRIAFTLLLIIAVGLIYFFVSYYPKLNVATAYVAKKVCSCHYVGNTELDRIDKEDLNLFPLSYVSYEVDELEKTVSASILGMQRRKAVFKDELGCSIIKGEDDYNVRFITGRPQVQYLSDSLPWPYGKTEAIHSGSGIDRDKIESAFNEAFDEDGKWEKQTRALLIIKDDSLVREQYSEGYDANSPMLGWSMTKSIAGTLIGILMKDGKVSMDDNQLFEEWTDERGDITLMQMLNMSSGLEWAEVYDDLSNATKMLYDSESVVDVARDVPLAQEPGTYWNYSSGTSNLLSGYIRNQFDQFIQYQAFPYLKLFNKLGMESAQMECDEQGNYVMSSYSFATARDWAKLGQLYLNHGKWKHMEILDSSYVDFATKVAPACSDSIYGGQIWLNRSKNAFADAPDDLYFFSGFQGQFVCVIPSRNLVVVRLGVNDNPPFSMNEVLKIICEAIPT